MISPFSYLLIYTHRLRHARTYTRAYARTCTRMYHAYAQAHRHARTQHIGSITHTLNYTLSPSYARPHSSCGLFATHFSPSGLSFFYPCMFMRACMYASIHACIYIYIYIFIYLCVCGCVCVYIYIYIYI
jgi:hypothetical protein